MRPTLVVMALVVLGLGLLVAVVWGAAEVLAWIMEEQLGP